jgi:hypothetical protein
MLLSLSERTLEKSVLVSNVVFEDMISTRKVQENVVLLVVYGAIVLAFAFGYTNFLTKNPRKKEML